MTSNARDTIDRLAEECPRALDSYYQTYGVNRDINLHSGDIYLRLKDGLSKKKGIIEISWLPSPRIEFRVSDVSFSTANQEFGNDQVKVRPSPQWSWSNAYPTNHKCSGQGSTLRGGLRQSLEASNDSSMDYVIAHIPNFKSYIGRSICRKYDDKLKSWTGRLSLNSPKWKVTIDAVEDIKDLIKEVKAAGGYCVTHVVRIEKSSGSKLTAADVDDALPALNIFLSLLCGRSTLPILPVGFDDSDNEVWKKWSLGKIDQWQGATDNWFDNSIPAKHSDELNSLFEGFMAKWTSDSWNEPLTLAVHWYTEANSLSGGVEGAIALTQIALEMLSWVTLVEIDGRYSNNKFGGFSAHKKIESLLSDAGIPTVIPEGLTELNSLATTMQWESGPRAFTGTRNNIIHAKKSKRRKLLDSPVGARVDAWKLGLWYLELVLLHHLGYSGGYSNRLKPGRWSGTLEKLPWT